MNNLLNRLFDIELYGRCPKCNSKVIYLGKDLIKDKEVECYECPNCGKWYI